jgi:hypothetical protein
MSIWQMSLEQMTPGRKVYRTSVIRANVKSANFLIINLPKKNVNGTDDIITNAILKSYIQ